MSGVSLINENGIIEVVVTVSPEEQARTYALRAEAAEEQTGLDRVQTGLDRAATGADRVQTGLDRTATTADRIAADADAAQTALDRIATAADRVQTGLDRTQTGLDRTATGQDKLATAADRTQTGLDRTQTGLDKTATAADRVQTGLDRVQTGADRVQTGLDRTAAATSASEALTYRNQAEGFKNDSQVILSDIQALLPNFPKPAVFALNKRAIQDSAIFGQKLKPTNDYLKTIDNLTPSLVMVPSAYRTGQLYSVLPENGSGDFTVSRNGSATFLGSNGLLQTAAANVPRFEYNPNGTFRGVLVEPSAQNLILRSEEFENNYWQKQRISATSNSSTAPNGTLTADKMTPDTTSNQHRLGGSANFSGQGVFSVYAKADGYNFLSLGFTGGVTGDVVIFNLSNGTISGSLSGYTYSIQSVGNGWYRCSIAASNLGLGISAFYWIVVRNANSTANYAGDGVSGVLVWGAQLELGSVATSYIPTVATTITRPADIITDTVPVGVTQIRTVVNGVEQTISPPGSTYQLPNGRISRVLML